MKARSVTSRRVANALNSSRIRVEHGLVVVHQVHLVDADEQVRDPQQRGQEGVTPRLLDDPFPGVDEHEGEVGGRIPRHHVARVLDVAGGVGDDELPQRRGEIPVRDVDGDALFALGPQAVGE